MKIACPVKKDVWDAAWMTQEAAYHALWGITCLNTIVTTPAQRRPTVKNLNAKHVVPTVDTATRTSVTGVKRASFSLAARV